MKIVDKAIQDRGTEAFVGKFSLNFFAILRGRKITTKRVQQIILVCWQRETILEDLWKLGYLVMQAIKNPLKY